MRPAVFGALLCAAAFLIAPAAAHGDPGRPGLDTASTAVYGQPGEEGKTLENVTPPAPQQPTDRNEVADEVASSPDEVTSPGGRGSAPEDSTAPNPASGPDESSPTVVGASELPFTGFAAALVLSLGLLALLAGAVLRRVTARPSRA